MSGPVSAYNIVILPPPDLQRKLMALRQRHPLLRSLAPPHITVKSPFLMRSTVARVVDQLETICEKVPPFPVQLGGLGQFGRSVIYVDVQPSDPLQWLHVDLVEGLLDFVETLNERWDGEGFNPHLTLAESLDPQDFPEVRKALQGMRLRRRFMVSQLHLLRGHGHWAVMRSFPLSGDADCTYE